MRDPFDVDRDAENGVENDCDMLYVDDEDFDAKACDIDIVVVTVGSERVAICETVSVCVALFATRDTDTVGDDVTLRSIDGVLVGGDTLLEFVMVGVVVFRVNVTFAVGVGVGGGVTLRVLDGVFVGVRVRVGGGVMVLVHVHDAVAVRVVVSSRVSVPAVFDGVGSEAVSVTVTRGVGVLGCECVCVTVVVSAIVSDGCDAVTERLSGSREKDWVVESVHETSRERRLAVIRIVVVSVSEACEGLRSRLPEDVSGDRVIRAVRVGSRRRLTLSVDELDRVTDAGDAVRSDDTDIVTFRKLLELDAVSVSTSVSVCRVGVRGRERDSVDEPDAVVVADCMPLVSVAVIDFMARVSECVIDRPPGDSDADG